MLGIVVVIEVDDANGLCYEGVERHDDETYNGEDDLLLNL